MLNENTERRPLTASDGSLRPGRPDLPHFPPSDGDSDDFPPGLTAIGPIGTDRKVREWALVLQSMSIWHVPRRTYSGWILLVHDQDYPRARASIDSYEAENRDWPPRRARERPRYASVPIPAILFAALAVFFLVTGPGDPPSSASRWFQEGTSVANLVLTSEPWRAVTALTLHGDSEHVMGNVISGAIFATVVHRRLGPGGGSFAIVASGFFGNLVNALFQQMHGRGFHASIGASTAVFGAVGILATTQILLDPPRASGDRRSLLEIIAPVVGGLAQLGTLGARPSSDLLAHLFGFLSGALVGVIAALPLRRAQASSFALSTSPSGPSILMSGSRPARPWVQALLFALAMAVILGSWALALR
jgi:membrane associated rhomboid family serine protease